MRFVAGIVPGSQSNLFLEATRTPEDWLSDWQTTSVLFPAIAVTGAARDRGALAVLALDDLAVRPETLEQLTPLDEKEKAQFGLADTATTLAYRYEVPPVCCHHHRGTDGASDRRADVQLRARRSRRTFCPL